MDFFLAMSLIKLVNGKQVVAVLCNQFGDSGKGKICDALADWADVNVRGGGGANAGHTVVVNGVERIYHSIPSGITYDGYGKATILGRGMVLDPFGLVLEIDDILRRGGSVNNLMVSGDAHVVLPYHKEIDRAINQSSCDGGIGSTGKGIGPCYTDKAERTGVRMGEFLDGASFSRKLKELSRRHPERNINIRELVESTREVASKLSFFVRDTDHALASFLDEGKRVLLEGAQGFLLSVEYGTYPYVTSSDPSINGLASGAGISARDVDLCLGVVKFPFMTRVGGGPFPTELGGRKSEDHCGSREFRNGLEAELDLLKISYSRDEKGRIKYNPFDPAITAMINSDDDFYRGVGIRLAAREYGATTGRPRRVGWTDAVSLRRAVKINGPNIILTKPDCLAGADRFEICFGYSTGMCSVGEFRGDENYLRSVKPVSREYEGYQSIGDVKSYREFPNSLRMAVEDMERVSKANVLAISIAAERDAIIVR